MKAFVLQSIFFLLGAGSLFAQTINATQSDALSLDNSVTGKADPGDKIRYTIVVSATGADATGVQVTVSPDMLTTLVGGSFKTSPVAVNDGTYDCIGNVGITVPAASGVKLNDFDDDLANATLSCGACTSANGGTVTIANDGSFTYLPAAGFTGSDNFTYTLTDVTQAGPGAPTTDMATVTINVAGMIWFVDENQGSNGSGRLGVPFNTLPNFVGGAADDPGDNIFLYSSGDSYAGGITLLNNQRLIGQGVTISLATATGLTVPTHSNALPATSGSRPTVVNATAGGDGITLASGNTIRGLNLGNCADFAIEDNGTVGTLTISEMDINTTGGAFQTDAGGTLAVTLGSITSTGGSRGIYLNTTGGSFTVTGATSCTNPLNQGIRITSVSTNVSFAAITIGNTGSGAEAMELNGNTGTFMATGLTTINAPAVGGNISLHISGGSGAITFANIDINGRRDKGIRIAGGNRNIITGTVDIDNANSVVAIVLEINAPTGGTIGFGATTINVGGVGSNGIDIQSSAAIVSFASGSAVSNSTVAEINVNLGAANITFNGSVTSTSGPCVSVTSRSGGTVDFQGTINSTGAGIGIAVGSSTSGTILFSGGTKTITSSTATGVNLTSNAGATINFTGGGLVVSTTSGTGFNATGGGTVTVQGTGNTINSTTGTALNVVSTTIGSSNLNFQSISANGAPNGIVLNNTGSNGGLVVTGDGNTTVGGNNSGGTIQNTTGVGISLTTTMSPSFTNMRILNTVGHGVGGTDVTNFTFNYGKIDGSNADALSTSEEANIGFYVNETNSTRNNLDGTVSIVGNQLTNAFFHGVDIFNFNGTISNANISTNTITSSTSTASSKGGGIRLIGFGSPTTIANISQATINQNTITNFPSGSGIQVQGGNAANAGAGIPHPTSPSGTYGTMANPIAITNNVLNGGASKFGAFGMAAVVNGKGSGYYTITGNSVSNSIGTAIAVSSFGFANVTAILTSNTIVANNNVGAQGIGAGTSQTWANTDNPSLTVTINNNNISQTDGNGILTTARDCSSDLIVKIQNNTVAAPLGGVRPGIRIDAGNGVSLDDDVCLNISGNTSAGSGGSQGIGLRKQGTSSTTNAFAVNSMVATSSPGVEAYIDGLNPAGGGTLLISATSGFTNCSLP